MTIKAIRETYLNLHNFTPKSIKAVFFDMDGVLFNSMPYHAKSWVQVAREFNLPLSEEDVYKYEGRTGFSTINILFQKQFGREATPQEIEVIYQKKCEAFNTFPLALPIEGVQTLVHQIKEAGLITTVVTGSGQLSLIERLNEYFPNCFSPELLVCSNDVKYGKPNPEPYLKALEKVNLTPQEAIVIENAPLGVQAAVAAKIMTIAVNTGPLSQAVIEEQKPNFYYPSMDSLLKDWQNIYQVLKNN